jgi:hypothetical protein
MDMVLVNEHVLSPIGLPSHMAHPAGIAPAPPVFQTSTQTSTPQVEMEPPPGFTPGSLLPVELYGLVPTARLERATSAVWKRRSAN